MNEKHTPGPWTQDGIAIAHMSPPYSYPLDVCLMGEPAKFPGDMPTMLPNHEANARLIAAAPDLLAALIEAADPISGYLQGVVLDRARAAIAKATGAA